MGIVGGERNSCPQLLERLHSCQSLLEVDVVQMSVDVGGRLDGCVSGELLRRLRFPSERRNSVIAVWRDSCIGESAVTPCATTPAFLRQRYHQRCIAVEDSGFERSSQMTPWARRFHRSERPVRFCGKRRKSDDFGFSAAMYFPSSWRMKSGTGTGMIVPPLP